MIVEKFFASEYEARAGAGPNAEFSFWDKPLPWRAAWDDGVPETKLEPTPEPKEDAETVFDPPIQPRKFWGKGYASEAARAAIAHAFTTLGWTHLVSLIHPENHRSARLAERLAAEQRLKRGELALVLDGSRVRVVEVRRAPKAVAS